MAEPRPASLTRLLLSLFSAEELRRFVRYLPDGHEVAPMLPGATASPAALADAVVDTLTRRGAIDAPFFQALRAERPRRSSDIAVVEAEWVGAPLLGPRSEASTIERSNIILVFGVDGLDGASRLRDKLPHWVPEQVPLMVPIAEWDVGYLDPPSAAVVVLCTPSLFADDAPFFRDVRRAAIPVVPVLVTASGWRSSPLGRLQALPRSAVPVDQWPTAQDGWDDVVRGLVELLTQAPPTEVAKGAGPASSIATPGVPIDRIFRSVGEPELSFVAPAQLDDLVTRLRFAGEGLVVDGPSGIGKTTAMREAVKRARVASEWLSAKDEADRARLDAVLSAGARALGTTLVVDDFHHLDPALQRRVADLMKAVADRGGEGKVVVIGINPVGTSLVQRFPDLANRFDVVSMRRQPDEKIAELVDRGSSAANIVFERRAELIRAARGSFATAQLLCREAALLDGVRESQTVLKRVVAGPSGVVLDKVLGRLKFKYHEVLVRFASHCEAPPPAGATLALLYLLVSSGEGSISLASARARFPILRPGFDWLMGSKLAALFQADPRMGELFFYNREAAVLSAEDPQLEFYLQNLSWAALARDSGHLAVEVGPEGGLEFGGAPTAEVRRVERLSVPPSRVLHLSDLHFSEREQALVAYDQLYADLTLELGIKKLDAVIVSGDLTSRAEPAEFEVATAFLQSLKEDFQLQPRQVILVPGNHDVSWAASRAAYTALSREEGDKRRGESNVVALDGGFEVGDPALLMKRFAAFADFYYAVRLEPYPLDYDVQATVHPLVDQKLVVVGLNSAWSTDHHHPDRADIHPVALGRALRAIQSEPALADTLRIAVWHHPIQSAEDARLRDTGFLERLAQAGFRLGLHGHIHKSQEGLFRFDVSAHGRRLDLCGAGTFGAPSREWTPGFPQQYQVLEFGGEQVTVHTRRKEEPHGAWRPDARWTPARGAPPLPSYTIRL